MFTNTVNLNILFDLLGAFLIPYIVMLITCGMPMYIMEVALGQYIAEGPIQVWRIVCPLFRGKINDFINILKDK